MSSTTATHQDAVRALSSVFAIAQSDVRNIQYTLFFKSNIRLKLAKTQAKGKQYPEAELFRSSILEVFLGKAFRKYAANLQESTYT